MAQPRLAREKHRAILAAVRRGDPLSRKTARKLGVSLGALSDYAKRPLPDRPTAELPEPVVRKYQPLAINTPGLWLVLSDLHLPYHDRRTVEMAVAEARKRAVKGVILNGDVLDSHEISRHDKDPSAPRYVEEVECGKRFLAWVRKQLPKARLIFKEGNHEERLIPYIWGRAPALFGLEGMTLPELLHTADYGIEWVGDKRVIHLGKLNVIHGHEYGRGTTGPVNPARGIYLKARSVVLCGHWHRTSEHHEKNIRSRPEAAWSAGCACGLNPQYAPLNNWNHGYAFVEISNGGDFVVDNRWVGE